MCKFEKGVNIVYSIGGIILIIVVIMAMSSCGSTKEIKKCCEKTVNEVYKYEKECVND
jgi:hypothetical protein